MKIQDQISCQVHEMRNDLLKGLIGSIAFTVVGVLILIFANPPLIMQLITWVMILFFGLGSFMIAIRIHRHSQPAFRATIPKDIKIQQLVPADEEIEEEWMHSSPSQPLLSVNASKWKEISEYRWQLNIYLATLARDSVSAKILDEAVFQALKSTRNVVDVCREDTEVWVISGEPNGKDLVKNAGTAVANCIPSIVPQLLHKTK